MSVLPAETSIPAMLSARIAAQGDAIILRKKRRGIWRAITWRELGADALAIAAALDASGLQRHEVVACLSDINPECIAADLGVLAAGCITLAIDPNDNAEAVAHILSDSGARLLFVENAQQLDKVLPIRALCPRLERIIIVDTKGLQEFDDALCERLEAFLARGNPQHAAGWEARSAQVRPGDVAVIGYTSGATGAPRGIALSHRNIQFQVSNAAVLSGQSARDERLAFLPLAYTNERILGLYLALYCGTISNLVESTETVWDNLREVQPTVMLTVPHVWKRFRAQVLAGIAAATPLQRLAFNWAFRAGQQGVAHRWLSRRIVLINVRRSLGLDRLRWAWVSSAPLDTELVRWFGALGVTLLDLYGLTESGGLAAAAQPQAGDLGTVGRPVSYGECRIADDGEILLRGSHVAELQCRDGWLHTGNLGQLQDGRLRIIGRRADTITLSSGETVLPGALENAVRRSPYIDDALVVGSGRPFLACIILANAGALESWAHDKGLDFVNFSGLVRNNQIRALIGGELAHSLADASGATKPRTFRIIEQRLEAGDPELTRAMTLRRAYVCEKYAALIDELYQEQ